MAHEPDLGLGPVAHDDRSSAVGLATVGGVLALGGMPLDRALTLLRAVEPSAHAFYIYDLDGISARARRFQAAFAALSPTIAFALKANSLPALLERLASLGLAADAASHGELEMAKAAGFDAQRRVLNGNGKSAEEIAWAAREGVHSVNADHVAELDALDRAAASHAAPAGRRLRVALRINPGIETPGHRYVATGDAGAKFGIGPGDALAAWSASARWPHLDLTGLHVHVGSQLLDLASLEAAVHAAIELADESAARGAPLSFINFGGGFGVDYSGEAEFPLERYGTWLAERSRGLAFDWVLEPGRWLVASGGVLAAEVLWVKPRDGRRFVVVAAGMNDLLRPALYHARHRIVAVSPRPGALEPASVVGPVCESADVFDTGAPLPPLEPGDLIAVLDVGAYGAVMSSNYNGRGRLPELVVDAGRLVRARAGESPKDLTARRSSDLLG